MRWLSCTLSSAKQMQIRKHSRISLWLISHSSSASSKSRCSTASRATQTSSQPEPHILHKLRSDRLLKASKSHRPIRSSQPNCNNSSIRMQCHLPLTLFHPSSFHNPSTLCRLSLMPSKPSLSEWTPHLTPTLVRIITTRETMEAATRVTKPCHLTQSTQTPTWPAPEAAARPKACTCLSIRKEAAWLSMEASSWQLPSSTCKSLLRTRPQLSISQSSSRATFLFSRLLKVSFSITFTSSATMEQPWVDTPPATTWSSLRVL